MGVTITTLDEMPPVETVTLDRTLWLNATKDHVVENGDPDAAFLYGVVGNERPLSEARKLGALPKAIVEKEKKEAEKLQDKQVQKPADKSVNKQASKS